MPLQPRFRRATGSQRRFVDREEATEVFAEQWSAAGDGLRVLNITGVGGIGKSRFLRECQARVGKARTALLDLQIPALREQDAALAVLRSQFGSAGVSFPRYDIAYLALWQRLHPHLRISLADVAARQDSDVLRDMVESAGGVPVFRTVVGLLHLAGDTSSRFQRWRWLRSDETLQRLDTLDPGELTDATTFLFAEDLRKASEGAPYLVCIDAYEALVGNGSRAGRIAALDAWLRDLVSQLDRGVILVASREPLAWHGYDAQWSEHITHLPLAGLPMTARHELLGSHGVADPRTREILARASSGVPFYLNLALDAEEDGSQPQLAPAVSGEEILERFLQHVDAQEVRLLEVLSAARLLDFEVFRTVATAYGLPRDRLTWEKLVSYSFVQAVAGGRFQLHQLMAQELHARLDPTVRRDVHRLLQALWRRRATGASSAAGTFRREAVAPLREVAFHTLHAGDADSASLLAIASEITSCGGARALGGVVEDMRRYCADLDPPNTDLETTALCVEAETAISLGDVEYAAGITRDLREVNGSSSAHVRLALAGADALRIVGRTSSALRRYRALWERATVPEGRIAALWAADLYMAGGRFEQAERLALGVEATLGEREHQLRGDAARLLHLGRRFSFDFHAAGDSLERAHLHYTEAGAADCLARLAVNRAELLAWTSPSSALAAADEAIVLQQEFGALQELGKAYTAHALAAMRLGRLDVADRSLENALEALGRARYRSGIARAQLIKAFILLRRGQRDNALRSAEWAVREFEAAEVYPTLVLTALLTLRQAGLTESAHTLSWDRARTTISAVDSLPALERRIEAWVATILGE